MRYITFFRENSKFDDIIEDLNLKKLIDLKIKWHQHLMIGIDDYKKNEQTFSYITLKYGDEMVAEVVKDHSPIPGVDYQPKKDASKYTKAQP